MQRKWYRGDSLHEFIDSSALKNEGIRFLRYPKVEEIEKFDLRKFLSRDSVQGLTSKSTRKTGNIERRKKSRLMSRTIYCDKRRMKLIIFVVFRIHFWREIRARPHGNNTNERWKKKKKRKDYVQICNSWEEATIFVVDETAIFAGYASRPSSRMMPRRLVPGTSRYFHFFSFPLFPCD